MPRQPRIPKTTRRRGVITVSKAPKTARRKGVITHTRHNPTQLRIANQIKRLSARELHIQERDYRSLKRSLTNLLGILPIRKAPGSWNTVAEEAIQSATLSFMSKGENAKRLRLFMELETNIGADMMFPSDTHPAHLILTLYNTYLEEVAGAEAQYCYILTSYGNKNGKAQPNQSITLSRKNPEETKKLVQAAIQKDFSDIFFQDKVEAYESDEKLLHVDLTTYNGVGLLKRSLNRETEDRKRFNPIYQANGINIHKSPRRAVNFDGRNTSLGSFYPFYLDKRFPENLDHLQVYKSPSQQKDAFRKYPKKRKKDVDEEDDDEEDDEDEDEEEDDGDKFEIGCLANAFLVQDMPHHQIIQIMEMTADFSLPVFPVDQFPTLCRKLNICITYKDYSRDKKGDKLYYAANGKRGRKENQDKIAYQIGKIQNHFFSNVKSEWTLAALTNFVEVYKTMGRKQYKALSRSQKRSLHGTERTVDTKIVTNGKMLQILTYGYENGRNVQERLVTPMSITNLCYRAELYDGFKKKLESCDLPKDTTEDFIKSAFKENIERGSIVCQEHKYGTAICDLKKRPKYVKEEYCRKMPSWTFKDSYGHMAKCMTPEEIEEYEEKQREKARTEKENEDVEMLHAEHCEADDKEMESIPLPEPEKKYKMAFVPEHYTVVAFDSETYEKKCLQAKKKNPHELVVKCVPYLFCMAYYVYEGTRKPVNFRQVDAAMLEAIGTNAPGTFTEMMDSPIVQKHTGPIELRTVAFEGKDCAEQISRYFNGELFKNIHVHSLAHNARFDVNMLVANNPYATIREGIFKGTSKMNVAKLLCGEKGETRRKLINVQCSYAMTLIPLKKFAATFKLKVHKEYMPYQAYTHESLYGEEFGTASIEEWYKYTDAPTEQAFKDSVIAAGCLEQSLDGSDRFCLWGYAKYYCKRDVEVTLQGYLNFRYEMYKQPVPLIETPQEPEEKEPISLAKPAYATPIEVFTATNQKIRWEACRLDILHAISLPRYAHTYYGRGGAYVGVQKCSGMVNQFLRQAVVGGKVMAAWNSPVRVRNRKITDLDGVSLYPSAILLLALAGGYVTGIPKFWQGPEGGTEEFPEELKGAHDYTVSVIVYKVGRPLPFPVLSLREEDGGRHFTNEFGEEGTHMKMNKTTLEDAIKYHRGVTIRYKQALYWKDTPLNATCGMLTQFLFEDRLRLKKEDNVAGATSRKYILNMTFGKSIQRPILTTTTFVEGEDQITDYMARHSVTMRTCHRIRDDMAVMERRKTIGTHYCMPHIGGAILAKAKSIMHEVMTLAYDNGIEIYYMDTDSMLMGCEDLPRLGDLFEKETGRKLEGSALTQFHGDFAAAAKNHTSPIGQELVVVGKKAYYVLLHSWDESIPEAERTEQNATVSHHARLKGVPGKSIIKKAEREQCSQMCLYDNMFEGKTEEYNIKDAGPAFKSTDEYEVTVREKFTREACLQQESMYAAREEYGRCLGDDAKFPYDKVGLAEYNSVMDSLCY